MAGGMPIGGDKRVTTELYAQAFNLLNRANYTSYSGVLTSPLFGQPVQAQPGRRIELGLRVNSELSRRLPDGERSTKKRAPRLSPRRPLTDPVGVSVYASTLTTTRRFWARPSRVLFGASGLVSP